MERQDRDAPARREAGRERNQEGAEGAELVVHLDPERLERPPHRIVSLFFPHPRGQRRQRLADDGREGECGGDGSARAGGDKGARDLFGVWFVGVLAEKGYEALPGDSCEEVGGGEASRRVHPHVERAVRLERESARRVVELHRGDAEVGENEVDGRQAQLSEDFREAREAGPPDGQGVLAEAEPAKARLGSRQLQRVGVEADQPAARQEAR